MIVDCHTYIWDTPQQLGRVADAFRRWPCPSSGADGETGAPLAGANRHRAAAEPVDVSIVVGFRSAFLDAEIPNETIANYVRSQGDRLIGFAGVDPSDPVVAAEELRRAREDWNFKGVAVAPAAQDFHPSSSKASTIYELAVAADMPILFHAGIRMTRESKLEYANPILLDEVARDFPTLKMVVAHLGYPWWRETLLLLAKHDNVFAGISGLMRHPFEAYLAMRSAHEQGVMDKLLFASGFPLSAPAPSIEALYGINHVCSGASMPRIPREALRGVVEGNALEKLGIVHDLPSPKSAAALVDEGEALT